MTFDVLHKRKFLFEELVKRDFKKKYKGTILGMGWSLLNPMLTLLVLWLVFRNFFGCDMPHFITYLFCGNLFFSFFSESTSTGMHVLRGNAGIMSKINVPKFLFVLSSNTRALINFLLSFILFLIFCYLDNIVFSARFILILYPVVTMFLLNIGVTAILSGLLVFFKDIDYLWGVCLQLIMYGSAIFYPVSNVDGPISLVFKFNPIYQHIFYLRLVVIDGVVPAAGIHLYLMAAALVSLAVGMLLYRRYDKEFLYYV